MNPDTPFYQVSGFQTEFALRMGVKGYSLIMEELPMLIVRKDAEQWVIKEEHRDPAGQPVWAEHRTETPPSMAGNFSLEEAIRISLLNLYPGENMLATLSKGRVIPITPFFIAPDDVRMIAGRYSVGPYATAEALAKAMADVVCEVFGITQEESE